MLDFLPPPNDYPRLGHPPPLVPTSPTQGSSPLTGPSAPVPVPTLVCSAHSSQMHPDPAVAPAHSQSKVIVSMVVQSPPMIRPLSLAALSTSIIPCSLT
jgi:hypothetical protein